MSNDVKENLIIYWNENYFLTWSDFKGTPNPKSTFSAQSQVGFQGGFEYEPVNETNRIKLKIKYLKLKATFRPMLSWVVSESARITNSILLKHEQGHFDLAEEFARKINPSLETKYQNKIFSTKNGTREEVDELMFEIQKRVAKDALRKLNASQKKYEEETNHGQIIENQKTYDKRFESLRK